MAEKLIRRGDIYWVDLPDSNGREIKDTHPALVVSNDRQNNASPLIVIIPITSLKAGDKIFSFQLPITLEKKSVILVDQIRTIDRDKFLGKVSEADSGLMDEVERKIHFVLALTQENSPHPYFFLKNPLFLSPMTSNLEENFCCGDNRGNII
jgi:mRNA interferase MazF